MNLFQLVAKFYRLLADYYLTLHYWHWPNRTSRIQKEVQTDRLTNLILTDLIMKKSRSNLKRSIILVGIFFGLFLLLPINADASLVAYWGFEENTGNTVYDSSGNNNTGTVHGATWTSGKYGSALSFDGASDGTDDYVSVPHSDSINLDVFTVSSWVSFYDVTRSQVFLDKRNGQWHRNYGLYYYYQEYASGVPQNDYLMTSIGDGSYMPTSFSNGAYAPVSLNPNQFYHVAATYDQSVLRLYLDGNEIASNNVTMPGITGNGDLLIGRHQPQYTYPTYGIIDEVRIYDHALSQSEILADMQAPIPEPATMLLLGSGLAGLAGFRRKFKK